jgi:long-subunit acyl-CoA synthetase (AMP-forming)
MAQKAVALYVIDDWIKNIPAGSGSKTENEIDETGEYLNEFISQSSGRIDDLILVKWNSISESAQISDMLLPLSHRLEKEGFFNFGSFLLKNASNKKIKDTDNLRTAIHHYLNFFRQSTFLKKIYDEKRWESLIHQLIRVSNFNLAKLFEQRVNEYGRKTLFKIIRGNNIENYKWQKVSDEIILLRKSLIFLTGSVRKQNNKVAFLLENSLQMAFLDLACLTSGVVNIMIAANSVPQHIEFIMNQTKAGILLVANDKQLAKVKSVKAKLPHLKTVVLMEGNSIEDWVITYKEMLTLAEKVKSQALDKVIQNIEIDSLASIMYTSGTTGDPKGIMFSQMNLVYKRFCRAMALPEIGSSDRFLSFLPLFHTFGRYLEMLGSVFWGAEYIFMENPARDIMLENMRKIKPTIFISIPKKWYELYGFIASKVDLEFDDQEKIKETVHKASGGSLKWGLSAAGFLEPEIFLFFQRYGIELMSGFGMTEATGGITMTPPGKYTENSLGKPLPGIEVKLANDGEMLIRGPYVMISYYEGDDSVKADPAKWLPTGDIMRQDSNGFYEIIDRKKEIYKNIKGETVAPQKIENYFRDFEFVKQVFLVGDHRQFNTVLICPEKGNPGFMKLSPREQKDYFSTVVVTVNKFLASFERIVDFRIIERSFNEENGELTPKGTYKRRVIEKNFDSVIQTMYARNFINLNWKGREVRIPNWFLREKSCLINDIILKQNGISIPKYKQLLDLKDDKRNPANVIIGNYVYENKISYLDFQIILNNPLYWLGNDDIVQFTGEAVYQWYRLDTADTRMRFDSIVKNITIEKSVKNKFNKISEGKEYSLEGMHYAVLLFQANDLRIQEQAINYLGFILTDDSLPLFKLALNVVSRPNLAQTTEARRLLFLMALPFFKGQQLQEFLSIFLKTDHKLLDENCIAQIIKHVKGDDNLTVIYNILNEEIDRIDGKTLSHDSFASSLLNLLAEYGIHHPTRYKNVRQILVRYQLAEHMPELAITARESRLKLLYGFRNWLGTNQLVAVDVETGEEYVWTDVITFDEDIIPKNREHLLKAIEDTSLVREAIFLLSNGGMVRLYDIPPGGIWVSLIDETVKAWFYRISVQTRYRGGFDFVLCLNKRGNSEQLRNEINWLIHISTIQKGENLVDNFGGYWQDYKIWTKEYFPNFSIEKFITRMIRKNDNESTRRAYYLWPFIVWSAAWAHIQFWQRTNYNKELENKKSDNISIPRHDYQTGIKFISIEHRKKSHGTKSLLVDFHRQFVLETENNHRELKQSSVWFYIFSALVNSEGEEKGIHLIREIISSGKKNEEIIKEANIFINGYENTGYISKSLYFAIRRFERWSIINNEASLSAQARNLNELYDTYHLADLEQEYPETRTNFFLHTVFKDSSKQLKEFLADIIRKQHDESYSAEKTLILISEFQNRYDLNEKEIFFLARLSYPHLKPTDTAEFISSIAEGEHRADIVIRMEDFDGQPYLIRRPISPKEISRLHQIFMEAQLPVSFRHEHQFLMAISERGHIIGGLFYSFIDSKTVYMEKIVVSNRYRRKGISEGVMQEFFNRMRGENMERVTTGFFRPEYFYRFGFKVERKYSGLVKDLQEKSV